MGAGRVTTIQDASTERLVEIATQLRRLALDINLLRTELQWTVSDEDSHGLMTAIQRELGARYLEQGRL